MKVKKDRVNSIKILQAPIGMLLLVTLLWASAVSVFAADYYTYNNHRLIGGVGAGGKQYYYVDSTANSYKSNCENAMSDWVYTTSRLGYTTPISFAQTTTRANSVIDILGTQSNPTSESGVLAWTEFYKSGAQVDQNSADWKYAYVKIYTPNLSASSSKGTIAHEIGHAFGLAHNNGNPDSVMCQTAYGRRVSEAQICDLRGINYLY